MQGVAFFATLFLAVSAKLEVDFAESSLTWEKPIQKVVRLLKEMSGELEKEAEEDEDMYEKLGCWCDTNEKEKTKANAMNSQRITDLGSTIEELSAKSAQLKVDIGELTKQVAAAENSLEESTSMRAKESNEFFEGEKDSIQNIESVKGAVMALGKTQDGAALDQESYVQIKNVLQRHFASHQRYMLESSKQHRMVMSFLQSPASDGAALLQSLRSGENAPQSGAIFGILKQMKESFETALTESQKDEETAKQEYAQMKSAKEEEISAGEELIDSKKVELGDTDKKNAMAKEDLHDTGATLDADTEFLANLKTKCEKASAEYSARSKIRNEEIQAVSQTIGILTDDDAKDLLLKFVQVSSTQSRASTATDRAAKLLQESAKRLHRKSLSQLAVSMKSAGLKEVGDKIGAMIGVLKKEQKDEVTQKDFCVKETHENEMQTTAKTNAKEDLTQSLADLETSKTTLADEISQLQAEITESQVETKRASEIRQKENQVFQQTITDAVATQKILQKALAKLESFYNKAASFLQQRAKANHKKSAGASAVVAMIGSIIDESKDEQKAALQDENDASAAYAAFIENTKASLEAMERSVVNKQEELAGVDSAKAKAGGDLKHTETDLLKLAQLSVTLHSECDFLVKFFDIRQGKRGQEIEVLQQAQAIISGAKF